MLHVWVSMDLDASIIPHLYCFDHMDCVVHTNAHWVFKLYGTPNMQKEGTPYEEKEYKSRVPLIAIASRFYLVWSIKNPQQEQLRKRSEMAKHNH